MRLQARCNSYSANLSFRYVDLDGAESVRAVCYRPNRRDEYPQRLLVKHTAYLSLWSLGQWAPMPV